MLLFLGLKRASRERDEEFHYGYGGERFIFGILSATGIFFVGCGVTVPSIADIHDVKTRQLTPESYTFKAEISLNTGFVAERMQGLLPPGLVMLSGEGRTRLLEEIARSAVQAVSDEPARPSRCCCLRGLEAHSSRVFAAACQSVSACGGGEGPTHADDRG